MVQNQLKAMQGKALLIMVPTFLQSMQKYYNSPISSTEGLHIKWQHTQQLEQYNRLQQ